MAQMKLFKDRLTEQDIMNVFSPNEKPISRSEIAGRLNIHKTKTFITMLEGLVERGMLKRTEEPLINRAPIYLYQKV
jgi:predicted transcriptional regulator